MRIVVGSENPVKVEAVRRAFARVFDEEEHALEGVRVPSGVPDQPWGEEETRRGASNRARAAAERRPDADAWVGVEGGVARGAEDGEDAGRTGGGASAELYAFARVAVILGGRTGESASGRFLLPGPVAELVRAGAELGEADDRVFGRSGSKREEGAVGLLTGGAVTRAELYAQAVALALCRFVHPELYGDGGG